jgi:hypothetical protein
MSLDLARLIDKLEPTTSAFDDSASSLLGGGSKHYYSNVNETIMEEDDEDMPMGSVFSGRYSKLKAQHDRSSSYKFLQLGSHAKPKKIKSICLESETILEELDEYNGAHEFAD